MLTHILNQVARSEELLNIVSDCLYFVTKFFEPINVSATHIYHSALELSPPSSIVRRLYYYQRHNPFPRVVSGGLESWDECIHLSGGFDTVSYTWSPCGRFVAIQAKEAVEIRDALSSELHSTLTNSDALVGGLAYSPDGCSLACLSNNAIVIWDIQTGGVTKEIRDVDADRNVPLTWSSDGGSIGTILSLGNDAGHVVRVYNVASGEPPSPVEPFWSPSQPYLWTHYTSFRVMTRRLDDQVYTIEIYEVGSVLAKIESFCIEPRGQWGQYYSMIGSFSPTTYRLSVVSGSLSQILILDIRNSKRLLEGGGHYGSHSFSSDGSLFAISSSSGVDIWKYTSSRYTPWRELPIRGWTSNAPTLQFSPTLSSILVSPHETPQVWRLDGPPIVIHPGSSPLFAVISPCGTYIAAWRWTGSTITITNLHSQTPPQFIDPGMKINMVTLTGNILLVQKYPSTDTAELVAWRLTEEGVVDSIFANRRAGRSDSIWTVSVTDDLRFSVEDQIVVVNRNSNIIHVYHIGTGEVIEPTQAPPHAHDPQYNLWEMAGGRHYPHYCELEAHDTHSEDDQPIPFTISQEGRWIKDPEGKHRLWIPVEWRTSSYKFGWFPDIATLRFNRAGGTVIIKF